MLINYYVYFWVSLERSDSQRSKVGSEGMVLSASFEVAMDMIGRKGMNRG